MYKTTVSPFNADETTWASIQVTEKDEALAARRVRRLLGEAADEVLAILGVAK